MCSQQIDIATWVQSAPEGREDFRKAVHLILEAISLDPLLQESMVIKGGMLLAIRYNSPRFTKDLDISTHLMPVSLTQETLIEHFDNALRRAEVVLEYGIASRVQRCKLQPQNNPKASFPSYAITIGYAGRGTAQHKKLQRKQAPDTIPIDFSFNEPTHNKESLTLSQGSISSYGVNDLIAEKTRSLLQQVTRERYRRQDVYDLNKLFEQSIAKIEPQTVLESLMKKSISRGITPNRNSLDNSEVKQRAYKEYHTVADEIEGDLPDFDELYSNLIEFYKSLPWETLS